MVYHVPSAFQCVYGCSDERVDSRDGEDGKKNYGGEWRLPDFVCADDVVL